ncbi:unnamed protein product [Mytilus edulis]|uniref:C-type lectin domain-containing protein n=1 Tax=Mytilus edulis TaxID=6550 RepID=A0A8S3SXS8_MYTED|nr:unnamed protein product [Mytilus edulis]
MRQCIKTLALQYRRSRRFDTTMKVCFLLLTLNHIHFMFCLQKTARGYKYQSINNAAVQSLIIQEKSQVVATYCMQLCLSSEHCLGFLYRKATETCQLSSFDHKTADALGPVNPEWMYYEVFKGCHSSNCRSDYTLIAEACLCLRVNNRQYYDTAKQSCTIDGAQLLRIDSPLKQTYLQQYLITTIDSTKQRLYIQGEKIENTWTFTDGTPMEYFNWALGQPNNKVGESYLFLSPSVQYKWEDGGKGKYSFICEILL